MSNVKRHQRYLWAGTVGVLAWRAAALFFPHAADTDPAAVRIAMVPLGLWFLACGLWAFRRAPGPASLLFAWYGVTAGIHWGGPLGVGPEGVQNVLLGAYIVLSTAVNQSLFLHLALAFPPSLATGRRRSFLALVYVPVVAGGVLLAALAAMPGRSSLLGLIGLLFPVGVLYSLAGGAVWISRLVKADAEERRERRLTLVVTAMVVGWLPHALVSSGVSFSPGYDGLANLALGLIPAALAAALSASRGGN